VNSYLERLQTQARAAVGIKPKIEVSPADILSLIAELQLLQERNVLLSDMLAEDEDE
jgi:hypothetical protein